MAEAGAAALIEHWTRELSARLVAELAPAPLPPAASPWPTAARRRVYRAWPWEGALGAEAAALAAGAPALAAEAVAAACERAANAGALAIEVAPCHLARAVARLRHTPVRVGVAVGGAGGAELASVKLHAVGEALKLGADEIVWNAGPATSAAELRSGLQLCAAAGAAFFLGLEPGAAAAALAAACGAGVAWLRLWPAAWTPPLPGAGVLLEWAP